MTRCPVDGNRCGRLDCDPADNECAARTAQWEQAVPVRKPQKFAIKNCDGDNYIHSEIDSGGMSVYLAGVQYADRYDDPDSAAGMMARCTERYPGTRLEVVSL